MGEPIRIVPFEPTHLAEIDIKACHLGEKVESISTPAITFLLGGEPISIFGGLQICPGNLQIWGLCSEKVRARPIAFFKALKLMLDFYATEKKMHRIQMSVIESYREGQRFAEALGFSYEGTMTNYGPDGSNYFLYARTRWQP